MPAYSAAEVMSKITPGFEALVSKASRGIEDPQMLREDPPTQNIQVIAISANAMLHRINKSLGAGFFHYLTKPTKVVEFMDVVDVGLDSSRTASDSAIGKGAS
jgi:CheY-like chemotaxis protein